MIEQIVEYNKKFVENKGYEPYLTSKYPNKKLAVLTCMDTRMQRRRGRQALGLLVAILELGVEQVMVIGHTDCGVQGMDGNELLGELVERGIDKEHIDIVRHSGIDLEKWLGGFESVEKSVEETVHTLKTHPLMPKDIEIKGFIMDSETGELTEV